MDNEIFQTFFDTFQEFIDIPDSQFSNEMSQAIKLMIDGGLSANEKDLIADAKERFSNTSPNNRAQVINEIQHEFNTYYNSLTCIDKKKELIKYVLDKIIKFYIQAYNELDKNNPVVYFELVHKNAKIPTYAHSTDACSDIYAPEDITIPAHTTMIIDAGFKMALPEGWEAQIRSRSGMAAKTGLRIANGVGTIDAGYRNVVGIIFDNTNDKDYTIHAGDRIAQMTIKPIYSFNAVQINDIQSIPSDRNGGFGSTGK